MLRNIERGFAYLLLEFFELVIFLLSVLFYLLLSFIAGIFDAFCAICSEEFRGSRWEPRRGVGWIVHTFSGLGIVRK